MAVVNNVTEGATFRINNEHTDVTRRLRNWHIEGNRSSRSMTNYVVKLVAIDSLTVVDNYQKTSADPPIKCTSCTGVLVSGNTFR